MEEEIIAIKKSNKKIIMIIAVVVIIAGAGISGYPFIIEKYFNYRQQELLNSWALKNAGIGMEFENNTPGTTNIQTQSEEDIVVEAEALSDEIFEEDVNAFFDFDYALQNMKGTLKIPDLNLISPILIGDTRQNLNIGICQIPDSGELGKAGNYVLAGHYSKIRGRHFNRLPEIQTGASVFISDAFTSYEYEVSEILQVKAEDTWAVQLNVQESMATLITCDYSVGEPYGRVVVKCKLKT